ncbi:ogr/Delta-like zinc finger family protein [Burkholderia gladioli]|uniref:ogr/Delta-like zinc finger family protein n=1 Tax=Burkholderia gladioli TaxID=28095 RepID=UPI00164171C3|nr:ogr/Delta-like zinc finger family protein [Burkholderia gladioli]
MRFTIACPYCDTRSIARALEKLSDTAWLVDFQCDNVRCGHTCRTQIDLDPPTVPIARRARRGTMPLFEDAAPGAVQVTDDESSSNEET